MKSLINELTYQKQNLKPMITRSLLFALLILFFSGCHDSIDNIITDPLFPSQITFRSSIFLEVVDTDHKPVKDALVVLGNIKGITDEDGFLYLANISMSESSYVTVEKEGYFYASRRFYPVQGKSQYVSIEMLPVSRVAFFNSGSGSQLELEHLNIHFPKDAYVKDNGEPYEGIVIVNAQIISADDPDLSFKMPGNLIGLNGLGSIVSLASYGMFVVEMRSMSGDKLQLKQGTVAGIEMKVPPAILANAPPMIPMWHFDEEAGIWKEEGQAILTGDVYVSEVSHFSFWNCDYPSMTTKWNSTFLYDDGLPAMQLKVGLTITDLNITTFGYTNEEGQISGFVPANKVFRIEVKDPCEDIIYTGEVGPFKDSLTTAMFTIPKEGLKMSTLTGLAASCEREAIKNLYAKIDFGDYTFYKSISGQQGAFSITFANCEESKVTLSLLDYDRLKYNAPQTFSYAPFIDAGTINVCKDLLEFVLIQMDSFPEFIIFNSAEYGHGGDGYSIKASDSNDNNFFIITKKTSEGYYPNTSCGISLNLFSQSVLSANTCNLTITHFGNPGELIQGTFKGNFDWGQNEYDPRSGFAGSFSVLRK